MHAYRDQYAQLFKDGQDVVLIGISADPASELYAWARDDQFQFLFASDTNLKVGTAYGALAVRPGKPVSMTNRNLFVVGPDGKIAYRAVPFREIDPTSYTDLAAALKKIGPLEKTP